MERGKSEERPVLFFHSFNFLLWPQKGETLGNQTWPAIGPFAKQVGKVGRISRHMGFAFISRPHWFFCGAHSMAVVCLSRGLSHQHECY